MIGRIKGILLEKTPPSLLIDVAGVAYELDAPMFTFYRLPDIGKEVILHTHLVVREDAHLLYGFAKERERALFRSLIKVSSVGPKMALAILSGIEPDSFVNCVTHNDTDSLIRIPGVGKKTAERLIIEMRDRLHDWKPDALEPTNPTPTAYASNKATQEATSALIALGYKPNEARQAVSHVADEHQSSEEIIRHALRGMLKGSRHDPG
jgi:Holliday junction DNA helicase RuvA